MVISIFSIGSYTTVELKSNYAYAIVTGNKKAFPFYLIIKCFAKMLIKKARYERAYNSQQNQEVYAMKQLKINKSGRKKQLPILLHNEGKDNPKNNLHPIFTNIFKSIYPNIGGKNGN